jgi:G3E family GTPase
MRREAKTVRSDYIMVGGFLGAGKTTALIRLASRLSAAGRRVGLITNDQSVGLVDTALVHAHGFPVEEITGGCFCCRFNSLTAAADRLTADTRPDVFLAEPVGSCTDLRASVQYPLRRLYGDAYRVAPLSVLVDPIRASRVLGVEPGRNFSPKVRYVFGKQLEEAEIIVINKIDLLGAGERSRLEDALHRAFPAGVIHMMSARTGEGLDEWIARIVGADSDSRRAPDIDYEEYAEGEALLGWFNGTFRIASPVSFEGNAWLTAFADAVRTRLVAHDIEVAHFKMTLTPDEEIGDLAVLNLVATDRSPEMSHSLAENMTSGELIVNLRAEGDPDVLRGVVFEALSAAPGARVRVTAVHAEHFRPAKPTPTHRMATVDS